MMVHEFILLLWVHFIADFVCQSDEMAINKSSSEKWLSIHVGVYTLFLIPFGPVFAGVNFIAHYATDWITSRASKKLWAAGERHWFFVVIGLDQALHLTVLFLTYYLIA